MGGAGLFSVGAGGARGLLIRLQQSLVFVIMAVQAKQLPVTTIAGIIAMVMVAMVDC